MKKQPIAKKISIEDIEWISIEAQKLWANQGNIKDNGLYKLLAEFPQPLLNIPASINLQHNPYGDEYRKEILKFWEMIHERSIQHIYSKYDPKLHEKDSAEDICSIRFPGYMSRRDPSAVLNASLEQAMLADILHYSGLTNEKYAIEFGAGSGNIAIFLSRLGIKVDTVDISEAYCAQIDENAFFYKTELKSHNNQFGFNPRGDGFKYDTVIFHSCFHHSLDHANVISKLGDMLQKDGSIILSNEPIHDDYYCPWGLRLDPESISVIACRGWMELGFDFKYLSKLFFYNGILLNRVNNNYSKRPFFLGKKINKLSFSDFSLIEHLIDNSYTSEPNGIWTKDLTCIPVPYYDNHNFIELEFSNPFPFSKTLYLHINDSKAEVIISENSCKVIKIPIRLSKVVHKNNLTIQCETSKPSEYLSNTNDDRDLGIFIKEINLL